GLADSSYPRVAGTAVFLTTSRVNTPPMLMHHLRHNQVLHEQVILLTVHTHDVPRVRAAERLQAEDLGCGISRLDVHYGFMQAASVPVALRLAAEQDIVAVEPEETTYYVSKK